MDRGGKDGGSSREDETPPGMPTRAVEMVVACAIFAFGALVAFDSARLGIRWRDDGPQAGYLSFYVGAVLCVCALVLLARAIAGKLGGPQVFATRVELRRVLQLLLPAAVYVLAIQLLGVYLGSACCLAFFMRRLGGYAVSFCAALGAGVMTAFLFVFELWLKLPLYKGLWDPLAWLGY